MTAAVEETGLGQAASKATAMVRDSVKTVIAASMVGTAIEFYDFYAYGTAAANYFPHIFFSDKANPTVALLMSLLTFAIAFIARPLGSLVFGHFGDRMGRKTTLVVSLMTMGVGTFLIGCLPTYDQVGVAAVAILCLLRFIQGIGLGGEWSGAALVATENAPEDKRALYGSFPELGAPIGFFLSNGTYFVLESFNDQTAMLAWGWRVPFLLSAILVHLRVRPVHRAVLPVRGQARPSSRADLLLLRTRGVRRAVPVPAGRTGRRPAQLLRQHGVPVRRLRPDGYRLRPDRRLPA